jgi:FAD/FMN-containing dehydrogenase
MKLLASSVADVVEGLARAAQSETRITDFDLRGMSRVLEYTAEDMTVTVEAGITLRELQTSLAERGQWLPIDPPNPHTLTIGAMLAANKNGPRRFAYGTIREYLLGVKVVLADGRVVKAGGKVVKNVAGYDLCKLFAGSRGTLGVIVEATFKVLPRAERETFVKAAVQTMGQIQDFLEKVNSSPVTPVVMDVYGEGQRPTFLIGFAGAREDVEWQLQQARELGFGESGSLEHEERFWNSAAPAHRVAVLPSKVAHTLKELAAEQYVARAGNGVIYYRGTQAPEKRELPQGLMRRIKQTYDPKGLLPELPW